MRSLALLDRASRLAERHLKRYGQAAPASTTYKIPDLLPHPVTWAEDVLGVHLDPWQQELVTSSAISMIAACARQVGKALALNTPLPTPSGWTTMGDVQPGDWLLDETGSPCRVMAVSAVQHRRECYEVAFTDGSVITADADHRWYVEPANNLTRGKGAACGSRGGRRAGVRTTRQLLDDLHVPGSRPGSKSNVWAVPVAEPLDLPVLDLPIQPYVLGVWLGDGNSHSANITVGKQDWDETLALLRAEGVVLAERCSQGRTGSVLMDPQVKLPGYARGYATAREYARARSCAMAGGPPMQMADKPATMYSRLKAMGLIGAKHVPPVYLRASIEQRTALLQGLLDSDGCIGRNGIIEFTNTREDLIKGVYELVASLGLKPICRQSRAMIYGRDIGPKWRITFTAYADQPVFRLKRQRCRRDWKECESMLAMSFPIAQGMPSSGGGSGEHWK